MGNYAFYKTSLSAITLPESLTGIGSNAFRECTILKSIGIPGNVQSIGSNAFQGCTTLTEVSVGNNVTVIKSDAFANCVRITSVTIPDSVTAIGDNAFSGCTRLASVDLGNVKELGCYIFNGCTSLANLTIPNTVTSAARNSYNDEGPFAGSSIKSIVFEDGIANIPAYICSGCTTLTSATLPEKADTIDGYVIGNYAFYKCTFLENMNIPSSITKIGSYAFANCISLNSIRLPKTLTTFSSNVFSGAQIKDMRIATEDSQAAITLIDNEIAFTADEAGIKDSADKYLNRSNTNYYAAVGSVSSSGLISLVIKYDFKANLKKFVSNFEMKIRIPSAASVTPNSLKVDGELVDYNEDEGYITLKLDEAAGTISFSVSPNDASYLMSYAQLSYRFNGNTRTETVGIVNMATRLLTVNVPDETSSRVLTVTGVALPNEEVTIYVDETNAGTCKASAVGNYSKLVILSNTANGNIYKIEVKTISADGKESSVADYVTFNSGAIKMTEFKMYYRGNEYDLMTIGTKSPVISWAGGAAFSFVVDFNDCSKLEEVRIVSSKGNEVRVVDAVYDSDKDIFVASGFAGYVPGTITVEYIREQENSFEGSGIQFEPAYRIGALNGHQAEVTLVNDGSTKFYHLKERETNATLKMSSNMYQFIQDGRTCYLTIEPIVICKNSGCFACKEFYVQEDDGSYTVTRVGVGLYDSSIVGKGIMLESKSIFDDAVNEIGEEYKNVYNKTRELLGILENVPNNDNEDIVYEGLKNYIDSAQNALDKGSNEYAELSLIKTKLESYKLVSKSNSYFDQINKYIEASFSISNDPDYLLPDDVEENMKSCVSSMKKASKQVSNDILQEILDDLTKKGWFGDSLIEKVSKKLMEDYEKSEVGFKGKYSIDPSGYVFEAVENNRLRDVKATVYFKETENSTAVVWDASEYDQSNPLYTDADGCYAWDVPEGLWQVKFEKEGYETAYSEWLPVPPPQLEINIGMTSVLKPTVELLNVYQDEIEIVFTQLMDTATINDTNIKVSQNGTAVQGVWQIVDKITSPTDPAVAYAKTFKFITYNELSGKVDCAVSGVANYAGQEIESDYSTQKDVQYRITKVEAPSNVYIAYKGDKDIVLQATPAIAAAGKKLTVTVEDKYIVSAASSVVFDKNGLATVKLHSLLPGETNINYMIEGTTCSGSVLVTSTVEDQSNQVDSIAIKTMPDKLNYQVGDTLVTAGLTLTVNYKDQTSNTIDSGFVCSPTLLDTAGTQNISVSYGGKRASFPVTVQGGIEVLPGDVNGDGRIAAADALLALQISLGMVTPEPWQVEAGAVTGEGKVTAGCALRILQYALGIIDHF
ncbi:MAG: leucine-rich repeat protein [Clostridia bacterium]|nr:leucine-rich repeat protein [Clostridia bacterium]